jgi:hypothetical protein
MTTYEVAWSPELSQELIKLQHPDQQTRIRIRAAELRNPRVWIGFHLRCDAVLAHARRGLEDPAQVFSATPMGIEEYLVSYLVLRPHLKEDQQEWLSPKIEELLRIAEHTREIRLALQASHPDSTPH